MSSPFDGRVNWSPERLSHLPRVAQRAGQRQELSLRPVSWRQGSRAGVLGRCPRARLAFTLGIGLPRPGPSKALPRGRWPVFSATRRFWSPDSAVTPRQPEHSLGQRPPSPPPPLTVGMSPRAMASAHPPERSFLPRVHLPACQRGARTPTPSRPHGQPGNWAAPPGGPGWGWVSTRSSCARPARRRASRAVSQVAGGKVRAPPLQADGHP